VHQLEVVGAGAERLPRTVVRLTTAGAPPLQVDVIPGLVRVHDGSRVAALVRVLVRDAGGAPVAGVPLELRAITAQLAPLDTVSTDASGRVLFAILPGALRASGSLGVFSRGAQLATIDARLETAAISEERTQFLSGVGQRGSVHTTLRIPLLLEVRDSGGAPVAGYVVRFAGTNAQVAPAATATDSAGEARTTVTLGDRAGPVVVAASVGRVTRTVNFFATAGPAQALALESQGHAVDRLALATLDPVTLRVTARDAWGNEAQLSGLAAGVAGGAARLRNLKGAAAPSGTLVLEPRRTGRATLTVSASGLTDTLPLEVILPVVRSGWLWEARAGGAAFNYGFKARPGVDGRPGFRGEVMVGRRIVPGLRVAGGVGLGVLRAQAGPASLAVGLMQGMVRGEYSLSQRWGVVPVLSLGGGMYRVKSTDPGNMVYHTSIFWLIGAGVDYPLAPRVQGELRLERQQLYEANSPHVNGAVGALTVIEVGARLTP
jgi:Big-like domain-containing protein